MIDQRSNNAAVAGFTNPFIKAFIQKNNKKVIKRLKTRYRHQFLYFPGTSLDDEELSELVAQLRDTADTCFEVSPEYQVMVGTREELSDKVIAVAWREDGKISGFCSTVILSVEGVGRVLHLGLTCVRPEDRSNGLTHILTHKAVAGYLLRNKPVVGKLWVSNCAAVLSSLANVSKHFEQVYPSPFAGAGPSDKHIRIAEAIDRYYRDKIYINKDAVFDRNRFVFRGSVKGTVFQKKESDGRFHHRDSELNDFYKNRMDFENGDEVLQIAFASTFTAIKHLCRNLPLPKPIQAGKVKPVSGSI